MKRAIYVAFVLLLVVVASAADTRGVGNLRGSDATHNSKDAATTLSPFHQLESAQVTQEHVRKLLFHGEIVKVLVKYKNANGMQHITDVASSTIAQSPKFHYIAITVDPQNLKELLNDPNIETVEFDSIVHAIRAVNWNHGNATATRRRRLAETVPWGIQRVQGLPSGQFVPPGPFANKIKVCVVDTGTYMLARHCHHVYSIITLRFTLSRLAICLHIRLRTWTSRLAIRRCHRIYFLRWTLGH